MSDLIQTIYNLVLGQYCDAERAMISRGEYELAPGFEAFQMDPHMYNNKTDEQRKKIFCRFQSTPCKVLSNTVTSTDGKTTVLSSPAAGKKPGQRKRKRMARTTTI